jgi:NitT/TauT family transport system permease protein
VSAVETVATQVAGRGGYRAVWDHTRINLIRILILAVVLLAWQYLPQISALRDQSPLFNPFFVSSPDLIYHRFVDLLTGAHNQPKLWSYLSDTLQGTFIGVIIGTVAGAFAGLIFSNSPSLSRVLSPFVVMMNATPRIALIPIFVIIAGPTLMASVVTAVAVVFFLVFYNAFNGGVSVPLHTIQNARLLGASSFDIMRHVRLPYVLVWTFASLPNAISFGLISVVTCEILTGSLGMGRLLNISIQVADSTLTFTVVVVLTIVGVSLVTLSDLLKKKVLHWWHGETGE